MPAVPSEIGRFSQPLNIPTESSNQQQIVADNTLTLIFDSDEDANAVDNKLIINKGNEESFVSSSFRQDQNCLLLLGGTNNDSKDN